MIKKLMIYVLLVAAASANMKMGNCMDLVVDERLPNVIEHDTRLSASKVYGIDKKTVVKDGATLTIEAGTTLAGCSLFSVLEIVPNAKIMARGTKKQPITFTSQMDLLGISSKRGVGEWGGVVIAGNAYTHYKNNRYEADETLPFGSEDHTHDHESSGVLEYVIIKHTGYEVRKDRELNGLSLAGVGSGTIIKNIAIIGGADDGIEIWGGKVNIDGLFVYNAMDDSVDVDLGYRGEIKNVLVVQDKVANRNNHDSSVMEFGNDENLIQTNVKNTTLPKITNFTGYIEGGGLYNKYDAGFVLNNVRLISEKEKENEMIYFRGKDSYTTGAKYLEGDVCFYDSANKHKIDTFFSRRNSKGEKNRYTPYGYFLKDKNNYGKGRFLNSLHCKGADESVVWKGDLEDKEQFFMANFQTAVKLAKD